MSAITISGAAGAGPAAFDGSRSSLVKLLIKNFLLTVVTLGIYRFWAKTDVRRYFWQNVRIGGEPIEYVGKATELLIGFLIVLAILVPLGIAFAGIQAALEGDPGAIAIFNLIFYLGVFLLAQIAIFRARRYRLTRTVWRGIRGGQDGSSLRYMALALGYGLLNMVTLGFANPWRRVALNRYAMNSTRFGNRHFTFDGKGRHLLAPWALVLGSMIAVYAVLVIVNVSFFGALTQSMAEVSNTGAAPQLSARPVWWPAIGFLAVFYLYTRYKVREFQYFADCTKLGDTTFASHMKTNRIILMFAVYGVMVLAGFVALGFAVAGIVAAGFESAETIGIGPALAGAAAIPVLLISLYMFVALPIIRMAWLYFDILKHVCRTLEIGNLSAVEAVVQDTRQSPKFGEGLADAFDVGAV